LNLTSRLWRLAPITSTSRCELVQYRNLTDLPTNQQAYYADSYRR
jgi:hypothetical protein